jgi:prophage antirepressor-like protein
MKLLSFLKNYQIRISEFGNICINDVVDYFLLPKHLLRYYNDTQLFYLRPNILLRCLLRFYNKQYIYDTQFDYLIELLKKYKNKSFKTKCIYLISTNNRAKKNIYKIGKHFGKKRKLKSRYQTPLIWPNIYFYCKVNNYTLIEKKILEDLDEYRIINSNQNKTEWVNLDKETIIEVIKKNIDLYDQEKDIEIIDNHEEKNLQNIINGQLIYDNVEIYVIIDNNGVQWFYASAIAKILQYVKTDKAIRTKVSKIDRQPFQELKQFATNIPLYMKPHATFINESGLYSLILSSRMPNAQKFRQWITSEILPSIRRTGSYHINK